MSNELSDNAKQAALWADTKTLWHIITRSVTVLWAHAHVIYGYGVCSQFDQVGLHLSNATYDL
eukprot:1189927-Prorocentrum_minimum.AAC.6